MTQKPVAVDLFCGCGAVTEGLKDYFDVRAAVDNDSTASSTYRANHPNVRFFEQDATRLHPRAILDAIGGAPVDLLVICAPCQPFSSQNRKPTAGDDRSLLILQAARYAKVLNPRLIFFENVRGLLAPRHSPIIKQLRQRLVALDYDNWFGPSEIDAADYGVPQRRIRCVMFAAKGVATPAVAQQSRAQARQRVTVRAAIGELPSLESGMRSEKDVLHFARRHSAIALKRFKHIEKDGGSRRGLPPELVLKCHQDHKGHPDVYGRMRWDDVAPTLTTGCTDVTKGRFMHPRDDRALTLREAARLQTFPDKFVFRGAPQAIARQIGNAVPIRLVREVGRAMAEALQKSERRC